MHYMSYHYVPENYSLRCYSGTALEQLLNHIKSLWYLFQIWKNEVHFKIYFILIVSSLIQTQSILFFLNTIFQNSDTDVIMMWQVSTKIPKISRIFINYPFHEYVNLAEWHFFGTIRQYCKLACLEV